jgi:hypothetical protein
VKRATKETAAGRRYLDLQREARRTGRPTDELIQLYALECFLDRRHGRLLDMASDSASPGLVLCGQRE